MPNLPLPPRPRRRPRPLARIRRLALALALAPTIAPPPLPASTSPRPDTPRIGAPGMPQPHTGSLLVDYYGAFLRDRDVDAFRRSVSARYSEATLARLLRSGDLTARRASVLALGLFGGFESNAAVAHALKDPDPAVRDLADNALWAIWFRADTPENNQALEDVRDLVGRGQLDEAIRRADALIAKAPAFAEAYNQRAIAQFFLGRFAESIADCRSVLERNPYHTGALSGMGQGLLRLGRRAEALATFRRALEVQPFNEGLRRIIAEIEADE